MIDHALARERQEARLSAFSAAHPAREVAHPAREVTPFDPFPTLRLVFPQGGRTLSSPIPPARVYTNVMAAHGGPFDVTLDFGYRAGKDPNPEFDVRVSMSWEHAVSMVAILQRLIEQYESQVESLSVLRTRAADAIAEAEMAQRDEKAG